MVFEPDLTEIISRLPEVSTRRTLEWFGDGICCNWPAKAGTARTDKTSTANVLRINSGIGANGLGREWSLGDDNSREIRRSESSFVFAFMTIL